MHTVVVGTSGASMHPAFTYTSLARNRLGHPTPLPLQVKTAFSGSRDIGAFKVYKAGVEQVYSGVIGSSFFRLHLLLINRSCQANVITASMEIKGMGL